MSTNVKLTYKHNYDLQFCGEIILFFCKNVHDAIMHDEKMKLRGEKSENHWLKYIHTSPSEYYVSITNNMIEIYLTFRVLLKLIFKI